MRNSPVYVTKTFLPPIEEYTGLLKDVWSEGQITNQGPLLRKLQDKLDDYLGISGLQIVSNGTIAIQLAFRALDIQEGEVITTPFSYVATTSAILWERLTPVFVDIRPDTLCIDADKIEEAITSKTKAILAVHVFGIPCDVEKIETIAKKHNIKVIYDAAHAFGVKYKGKSLLNYGDISTISFHATKLYHTIEGGGIVAREKSVAEKIDLLKRFGHYGDEHLMLGINAKTSEFNAVMGLCNLKYIDSIISDRNKTKELYDSLIGVKLSTPKIPANTNHNHAYYPVLFTNERLLLQAKYSLEKNGIYPRRYFYPSLNNLKYIKDYQECPVSEDYASRILCLPIYYKIKEDDIRKICQIIN